MVHSPITTDTVITLWTVEYPRIEVVTVSYVYTSVTHIQAVKEMARKYNRQHTTGNKSCTATLHLNIGLSAEQASHILKFKLS